MYQYYLHRVSVQKFAGNFTMSLLSFQEHKDIIDSIAKSDGFDKYESEESLSKKSELGEVVKVSIKDENRELNILFKLAPVDDTLRGLLAVEDTFRNEIWIYEKIFPEFEKFQQDNGELHGFDSHPKCYATCDKKYREAIILEDFRQSGYKCWNRRLPMDHNHLALVMREYAKLHAISLALNKKNPERFRELKKLFIKKQEAKGMQKTQLYAFIDIAVTQIYNAVREDINLVDCLFVLQDKFIKLVDGAGSFYPDELLEEESKLVFNHGIFWGDNMVFKYEEPESSIPSKVLLLEWHSGSIHVPAFDVANFLFLNSAKELLYDYKSYLKIYHDQLSESLKNMSCDAEEVYSLGILEENFKLFAQTSLLYAPVAFSIQVAEEEPCDILRERRTMNDVYLQISGEERAVAVNQRIRDLMTFMMDSGFI